MSEEVQQLDRKDLKIMALKEKIAELEDLNAELRVDVTILNSHLGEAQQELSRLQSVQQTLEENFEVVQGEVTGTVEPDDSDSDD